MTEPMQYDVQLYPVLTVIKFRCRRYAPPAVLTLNEEEAAPLIAKGYLGAGTPMPESEPQEPPAPESESANAAGLDELGDPAQAAEAAAPATADHASYADMPEPAAVAESLDQAELQTEPGQEAAADAPASLGEDQPEGEPAAKASSSPDDAKQDAEDAPASLGQDQPGGESAAQASSSSEVAKQGTEAAAEVSDGTTEATGQGRPAGKNKGAARPRGR